MIAGHLQEKYGFFYIVLSYRDENGKRHTPWFPTKLPVKGNKKRAEALLKEFGLFSERKKRPSQISGGQQQRVMIARAMIGDPKLLILDEPTTGVDARSTKILYDMLYEINTKYNTTIFMITHGRLQECKGCDRILRMDEGRIVEE